MPPQWSRFPMPVRPKVGNGGCGTAENALPGAVECGGKHRGCGVRKPVSRGGFPGKDMAESGVRRAECCGAEDGDGGPWRKALCLFILCSSRKVTLFFTLYKKKSFFLLRTPNIDYICGRINHCFNNFYLTINKSARCDLPYLPCPRPAKRSGGRAVAY